jgi:hypothetical protein
MAKRNTCKTLSMYDAKHFIWQTTLRKALYNVTRSMNENLYSNTRDSMDFIRDVQRGIRDHIVKVFKTKVRQPREETTRIRNLEPHHIDELIRRISG